jgi:hypothetical protein
MLFEVAAFMVVLGLAYWLWRVIEARFWGSTDPQPGERWKLIDVRASTSGTAHLIQSEDDGKWGVEEISTEDGIRSRTVWYPTEHQAREAFARIQL